MAEKKEAFGLSLLDVLSNALLGGIVLMMIAAVSVSLSNMQSELDKDDEQGLAERNSAKQFKPIDKVFLTDSMLICSFETKGGNPSKCFINCSTDYENEEWNRNKECLNISQGYYQKNFWVITRECNWKAASWSIFIKGNKEDLPDSIFININIGIRPISSKSNEEKRVIVLSKMQEDKRGYELVEIYEQASGDPEIYIL